VRENKNEDEEYSSWSIVGGAQAVFWGLFFILCLIGAVLAILGVAPKEDQISPYPSPLGSTSNENPYNEPNFANSDPDGFLNGQR